MRNLILAFIAIACFSLATFAQKPGKPTLESVEPTPSQLFLIQQGIALHDAGQYDVAITKYRDVLNQNPACTLAMYELALTLSKKGAVDEAIVVAFNGLKYKSKETPFFYLVIANAWDNEGRSEDAIKLYLDGIEILRSEKKMDDQLSVMYYNLGVAYFRLKKYTEAREAAKDSVKTNFAYVSSHYLLAEIFFGTRYPVPAMLASGKLLSVEQNTQRSSRAVKIFVNQILGAKKNEKGDITINLDFFAPKDEGEFSIYDLLLPTLMTVNEKKDEKKSEEERFVSAIDTLVAMLSEDKKLKSTFSGKTYIPFYAEMKSKGFTETFAYLVLAQNGNKIAADWLSKKKDKFDEFKSWAKAYTPSK